MNPQATNHPISYFKKFHDDDELDLSPHFQRKPVWTNAQASYLIDSILNELPVPEIFVRSVTQAEGDTKLEVVDGQQRLRAIILFYQNDLTLSGPDVTTQCEGSNWASLSKEQRKKFFEYKIVVRELENTSDVEVRDMFRRLNANQSNLNDQELRHSQFRGHFISCVEDLADDRWWLENHLVTPTQVRRMLDVEYVSELLVGLMAGPLDKKEGLDQFYEDYDEEYADEDYWRGVFDGSAALAEKLVDGEFRGWRSKAEFYSLFLASGVCIVDETIPSGKKLQRAQADLKKFREHVNAAKRKDNTKKFDQKVHQYADSVTRASSDLGRRVRRIDTILSIIDGTYSPSDPK